MESGKMVNETREIKEVQLLMDGDQIRKAFPENRRLILFLDYDGTLSPIVNRPEDAVLLPGMESVLEKCAARYTVAIVSGRDTDDVAARTGIKGIIYAGSHGFSIKGPGNLRMEHEKADEILPKLSTIEKELNAAFSNGPDGVQIERKRYAITIHYRNADPAGVSDIKILADQVVGNHQGIKKEKGKMIIEIKPDIDWHKGMALKWILEKLNLWDDPGVFPVYVGDDVTDEDAFRMLQGKGMGIIVGSHSDLTSASFRLRDVKEVKVFLEWLLESHHPITTT
jgi:trehalose 6-phosphate phosphatase